MLLPSFFAESGNYGRLTTIHPFRWRLFEFRNWGSLAVSFFFQALDQANMNSEGISLSMEEQLSALSLTEPDNSDPFSMVNLFGTSFGADLFEMTKQSTKVGRQLQSFQGNSRFGVCF